MAHNWQYRIGGVPAFTKLIQEQICDALGIYDPYTTRWNLESMAQKESYNRPWYMQGGKFDKFYP